ncbi:hypothetical protein [Larsenimonas suaedae]|uniref:PD-(D/E)XK endonuclease-like domain-containing protein n=1 Tax=Larsenimonas suaedae TaxID=1851019 RepID=A0ABU1GZ44_9GAMM|nr:hypothetical protein [Larsenimonas suaedae]MCM2973798.1 hypothetical protein [Larsenimonas suaedae]MDR5897322.1 hypothetical protein [Larsenimonas suaedae]
MRKYLNTTGVPLSLAVFLASDKYDHEEGVISATSLIKPIRQLVLAGRVPPQDGLVDISTLVNSRMGTAIHDGIEGAWTGNYHEAMKALGYPQRVIDRVVINPEPGTLTEGMIPVYLERRSRKQIGGYTVSGKFDFVAEGRLEDFKSTSVMTWIEGRSDMKYILQGSIYRWLNQDIITSDTMAIQFIFTDWSKPRAMQDPKYPQARTAPKEFDLMPLAETESYIRNKLHMLDTYIKAPEHEIPRCTDEDLWRKPPQWKYYRNPQKMTRSTKNFDNKQDAMIRLAQDGNVGTVVEHKGEVIACRYCPGFMACTQKDELMAAGDLKL